MISFLNLKELEKKEPVKGFRACFVHSDNISIAYWDIRAGALLPEHAHAHEQVVNMLEGQFELTIDGEARMMEPDDIAIIPSNVSHRGHAITECRIIDVFYPVREDYL